MARYLAMLALCLVAAGLFAYILVAFLRRLQRIEDQMWGEREREAEERRKQRLAARSGAR